MFRGRGLDLDSTNNLVDDLQTAGKTAAMVGAGHKVIGLVTLRDQPRADAKETVAALHEIGVEKVVMLTGDNPATTAAIAADRSIDETLAELTPRLRQKLCAGWKPITVRR